MPISTSTRILPQVSADPWQITALEARQRDFVLLSLKSHTDYWKPPVVWKPYFCIHVFRFYFTTMRAVNLHFQKRKVKPVWILQNKFLC